MPPGPKKSTARPPRPEDVVLQLREEVAHLQQRVNGLTYSTEYFRIQSGGHEAQRDEARHSALLADASRLADHLETKLATACVNTQYKVLQRMFVLRVREAHEATLKLTHELNTQRSNARNEITVRDKMISDRDLRIEQLQSQMNSLHYQLERVVLEALERLENRLDEDWTSWEERAVNFHSLAKHELLHYGFANHTFI